MGEAALADGRGICLGKGPQDGGRVVALGGIVQREAHPEALSTHK